MPTSSREQQLEDIQAGPRRTSLNPSLATPPSTPGSELPAKLAVELGGNSNSWELADLSREGAFLHGGPLRQQGAELQLTLWLRDVDVSLEIPTRARVAWLNDTSHPTQPGRPTGMGVTFCDIAAGDLELLSAYLKRSAPASQPEATGSPLPARTATSASSSGPKPDTPARLLGAHIGAYRIVELIGSGGMADVFLAVHKQIGRKVALKKLNPSYTQDASIVRRFFDEARVVNQIHHPNIIEITDFIVQDDGYYYVMELLDGPSLEDLLRKEGSLPGARLLHIAVQLCDAIAAVHQAGVVHRDLKPANVMLIEHGDEHDFVKLLDFGIAKLREPLDGESLGLTIEGTALGTPGYMAPEQFFGKPVDERSDVYALGVILYRMITGRMPHAASTPFQMLVKQANEQPQRPTAREAAQVPRGLVDLAMACLNKSPAKRPKTAVELASALRSLQDSDGGSGLQENLPVGFREPSSDGAWRWFAIGLGITAVIAVSGAWWLLHRDQTAGDSHGAAAVPAAQTPPAEQIAPAAQTAPAAADAGNAGVADTPAASVGAAGSKQPARKAKASAARTEEASPRARKPRPRRSNESIFDHRPSDPRPPSKATSSSFFDQFSEGDGLE